MNAEIRTVFTHAVGHKDVEGFVFERTDRVWVLSYSRLPVENVMLLDLLKIADVRQVIYFSSATTNVTAATHCYEYPRAKAIAADYARNHLKATVVLLGLVYNEPSELPGGRCAAVSVADLSAFLIDPPDMRMKEYVRLFAMVETPFGSALEKSLHAIYDNAQRLAGSYPCILRPLDLILRALGWRWYGYLNLSNRLWNSTTS